MTAACQQVCVESDIPEKEMSDLPGNLLSQADVAKCNPKSSASLLVNSCITVESYDEFLQAC